MPQCQQCNRQFRSSSALDQHCRALSHGACCIPCQRWFVNVDALEMHVLNSPKHQTDSEEETSDYTDESDDSDEEEEEPYCKGCKRWFVDVESLYQHLRDSDRHNWCFECSRDFNNPNALTQHQNSLAHKDRVMQCPFCKAMFKSPSGVAFHVESGCHGVNRHQVTAAVHALRIVPTISVDRRLEGPTMPTTLTTLIATEASFNGSNYECYLCHRTFRNLSALNTHLNSPAHDADEFKCPKCKKEFKLISGLVQHIESEVCNVAKFRKVEKYYEDLTAAFTKALKF